MKNRQAAPMDIGFYRYSFLNRGGDRVVVDYANYLAETGHQITFHTCIMRTLFTLHPAITINHLPVRNEITFLLYPLWHRLPHDLLLFDIIHSAPFLSLRHQQNLVYFAQADDVEYYGAPLARTLIDILYQRFFKKQIPTITVSEALSESFTRRYNASCQTVTNGINLQTFYPDPDPELLREKGGRKAIFFMARGDHYRKGFDIAMEVFEEISADPNVTMELWACGDLIPPTPFSFPVRQFGVVDDARLRQLLSSADIFFYPSRHEGFGLFPLEAMACGCVVVTTNAVPYAKHSENALVAPVEDCGTLAKQVFELLHNPTTFSRLRQDGITFAQKYSFSESAQQFEQVLARILKNDQ